MVKTAFFWIILSIVFLGSAQAVAAGPSLNWSPASGSYSDGAAFSVVLQINSGTEKVLGVDVVGSFDSERLELASIEAVASKAFEYDTSSMTPLISNSEGTYEVTLAPINMNSYAAKTAVGDLLKFNFRAKATGTAAVRLTCQAGSTVETNIMNDVNVDVVDCASNGSGSYTIGASSSTTTTTNPTATPTTAVTTTTTTTSSSLPQTGAVETTVALVMFGVISMLGALFLRVL